MAVESSSVSRSQLVFRYCGFQFFFSLLLWLPIFYEYQKRLGLDDSEIARIQSLYYIAFCLLEIPTGILADRWGKLACLRLASVICFLANLMPTVLPFGKVLGGPLGPGAIYFIFLSHFFLLAVARSLISGASSAYLYDHLKAKGEASEFKKIEGQARSYGLMGKVAVWPVIGFLMSWHLSLPYSLTAVASALSIVFAWSLPGDWVAPVENSPLKNREGFFSDFNAALKILLSSPILFLIMFQGIAVFVLSRVCQVNLFHPLLVWKLFDISSFGSVMTLMTVFEAAGSIRPGGLRRWMSDLNSVFFWTSICAICLFFLAVSGQIGTLVSLALFSFAVGICFPIQRQLFNDAIPEARYRATLMSIESILDRAVCAWVVSLLGSYVSDGKIENFLTYSAGLTGAGILFLILIFVSSRSAMTWVFTKAR